MPLTPDATTPHSAPASHSNTLNSSNDNDILIPIAPSTTSSLNTLTSESTPLPTSTATTQSEKDSIIPPLEQKSTPSIFIDTVTDSLSNLSVNSTTDSKSSTSTKEPKSVEEELSPEEAQLRDNGLKSTHRPGFYIHINSPRRLRIQTKSKTFDLDRYCPHANADLLKWGVLRDDLTLRCGVHYWGFDLVKNGQCIAHPDETLNACPVSDLEW
ncbi:hypothetical protein BGZ46_009684 [Entomortierella lignicola]|nr:hypothetical protein BGZ46_009684 [Entomortierella lignicola]